MLELHYPMIQFLIIQFIINKVTVGIKAAENGGNVQAFYLTVWTVEEKIEGNMIALSY